MNRVLVAAVITALCAVPAAAAAEHDPSGDSGGFGYFLGGTQRLYLGSLKHGLVENGYPAVSDAFMSFGGGGHFMIRNRFIIGGEGGGLVGDQTTRGPYKVSVGGGYGFFDLGVVAFRHGEFRIYPLIGIGGGGLSVDITDTRAASFGDILRNPARSSHLESGTFLMQGALGVDYLINFSDDPFRAGGVLIGLRVGYVINPMYKDMVWDNDGAPIGNGPTDVFHGPYVRLMLGGGGRGPHDDHHGCRRDDGDCGCAHMERPHKAAHHEKKPEVTPEEKKDEAAPAVKKEEPKKEEKKEEPKPGDTRNELKPADKK